jgi:hypothetical protein
MVGKLLHMLGQAPGVERLDGCDNPRVEVPSSLVQKVLVRYLMRERVLERVLQIREQAPLVEALPLGILDGRIGVASPVQTEKGLSLDGELHAM